MEISDWVTGYTPSGVKPSTPSLANATVTWINAAVASIRRADNIFTKNDLFNIIIPPEISGIPAQITVYAV